MARPPIRLRNSWKSSCPLELRSNLFIMRSRTPGSFWFFVKAPSSVFMKIRNSALESLLLLPSLPACFWKTSIRDSMHRSVSIGLDTFAMSERSEARGCEWGAARRALKTFIEHLLFAEHCTKSSMFIISRNPHNSSVRCVCVQLCLTLCNPRDCNPQGSSVHGIFQTRILEWVAISYSRGSSWPRNQTWVSCVSCIGRQILYTTVPPGKPHSSSIR